MIFDDKFNLALNYMCNFDSEFKRELTTMQDSLPRFILDKCEACEEFYEETEDGEYSLDLCAGQVDEGKELEFQCMDFERETRYLLNVSALDYYDVEEIPFKGDEEDVIQNFKYELGSLEFFGVEGCSLWEYCFKIERDKYGYHLVMTKCVDDGTEAHGLVEERKVDKIIDINEIVFYVNPKNLN